MHLMCFSSESFFCRYTSSFTFPTTYFLNIILTSYDKLVRRSSLAPSENEVSRLEWTLDICIGAVSDSSPSTSVPRNSERSITSKAYLGSEIRLGGYGSICAYWIMILGTQIETGFVANDRYHPSGFLMVSLNSSDYDHRSSTSIQECYVKWI